jgi:hypothetical protein
MEGSKPRWRYPFGRPAGFNKWYFEQEPVDLSKVDMVYKRK